MALGVIIPCAPPYPFQFQVLKTLRSFFWERKATIIIHLFTQKKKKICHPPPHEEPGTTVFLLLSKLSGPALARLFWRGWGSGGGVGKPWYVMSASSSGKCSSSHRGWFQVTSVIATSTENAWSLSIVSCLTTEHCVPDSSIGWSQHTPACDQPFLPQMPCSGQVASEPFPGQSGSSIILPWPACPFLCQQWWICQLPPPPHMLLHFTFLFHESVKKSPWVACLTPWRRVH